MEEVTEEQMELIAKVTGLHRELSIRLVDSGIPAYLVLNGLLNFVVQSIPREAMDEAYHVHSVERSRRMSDS